MLHHSLHRHNQHWQTHTVPCHCPCSCHSHLSSTVLPSSPCRPHCYPVSLACHLAAPATLPLPPCHSCNWRRKILLISLEGNFPRERL
ncbi:hypothetical protein E2C01_084462 [Portunus trituberculatus]|uniref:Uncharacterized protein n=1 Tax=Portunus trituberculatus TaxID=210409 RepID=A0A5B7IVD4_PORTR|nr:hypothetical protein [Portunus trituberculatus]